MSAPDRIVLTCAERDAAGIPVPPIVAALGYATWTEWAEAMNTPHPLLMEMKWKSAPEGTDTYDPSPARLPGDAHGA